MFRCYFRHVLGRVFSLAVHMLCKMTTLLPCAQAEGVKHVNSAISSLYRNGVWIERGEARVIAMHGIEFLRNYSQLAWLAFRSGSPKFPMQPKFHYLNHTWVELLQQSQKHRWCLSPLIFSCKMQEDFIGKPSRLSRRCNPRSVSQRVLQRSFAATRQCLRCLVETL